MKEQLKIAIVGLGYVGLPLLRLFSNKFNTIGYDINENRINLLKKGIDSTNELDSRSLKNLIFTNEANDLSDCNVYIITVPTPVNEDKIPDLNPIKSATTLVSRYVNKDNVVIFESTVYPGCTEEICVPIIEDISKLKLNDSFYVGYSPERIVPGDKINTIEKIVKVTSGSNSYSSKFVDDLYKQIIDAGTFRASSIKVAEASKAIENAQRDLNISFVNELSIIFSNLEIETTEVIEAASTKWNFHNYKPGLVGGHCIGVDPYYLTYKSIKEGYIPDVILSGRKVNESMGERIVSFIIKKLLARDYNIKNLNVLILGFTFKENCPDIRNTGVNNLRNAFKQYAFSIDIYDPYADQEETYQEYDFRLIEEKQLKNSKYDVVVLAVAHNQFSELEPRSLLKNENGIVYDIKTFFKKNKSDYRL